ncbi:MAG: FAD-binding oxidoreductase [Deltaproteobacteria bacterium]
MDHDIAAVTASFGPGQARSGRSEDSIDGITPGHVITARTFEDVLTVVQAARENRLAIVTTGGGSQLGAGAIPEAFDLRLQTTGMADIIEQRSEDLTVTAGAGVNLARLNRSLEQTGQRVALDPAHPERATLGGLVATGASGGLAYGFGACRDMVLGLRVVDGSGRYFACGGKVVKNVSGYDLPRLFCGSLGTLAVITEVTLRTHPLAHTRATVVCEFPSDKELGEARRAVFASSLPLAALDFTVTPQQTPWTLLACVEGTRSEVDYQIEGITSLCRRQVSVSTEPWHSPVHPMDEETLAVEVALKPAQALAFAAKVLDHLSHHSPGGLRVSGHLGSGLLCISTTDTQAAADLVDGLRRLATGFATGAVVLRATAEVKEGLQVWDQRPQGFELMKRIKERFDPDRVLSPGRFVGGL